MQHPEAPAGADSATTGRDDYWRARDDQRARSAHRAAAKRQAKAMRAEVDQYAADGPLVGWAADLEQQCHLMEAYVSAVPVGPPMRARSAPRPRAPHARPRRTSSSSSTSGTDPGDSDSDPPPPPRLTLWRHPRYGATSANLLRVLLAEEAS